jgi:Tfp pilus assembly protein PilV
MKDRSFSAESRDPAAVLSKLAAWTLIEAVVALAVLGLGISGVLAINSRVLSQLRSTRQTTAATHALQERMDATRRATWLQLTDVTYLSRTILGIPAAAAAELPNLIEEVEVANYPPGGLSANAARREANGTTSVTSTNVNQGTDARAVRVLCRLTWTGANGSRRTRENTTIVAKDGITE